MATLFDKAKQLKDTSDRRGRRQAQARAAERLQTRCNELQPLASASRTARDLRDLLSRAEIRVKLPIAILTRLSQNLRQLEISLQEDTEALVRPNALPRQELNTLLQQCHDAIATAWRAFVAAPSDQDPLLEVLKRLPSLKKAAANLAQVRKGLSGLAQVLPTSARDIKKVQDAHDKQQQQLQSLEADGMDRDVVEFLRQCGTGAPLRLIADYPQIMEWITEHELLDSFTVRG